MDQCVGWHSVGIGTDSARHGATCHLVPPNGLQIKRWPTTAAVHYNYGIAPAAVLETVRKLRLVCERFNTALPAAALRFPAGHPAVRCVLAGLSAVRELEQALAWLNQPIGQELWLALRETGLLQRAAPLPT